MPNARHAIAEAGLAPRYFALVLGAFIIAAFPGVLGGLQSFFYRDYGVISYPFVHYLRESLRAGEWPLWNPLSNCGAPFLAQWGPMVLYPFSLVYILLPLPWSLGLFCLGHLFLGGLGMYYLAHRWTGDRFAASVAGVAFAFNGVSLSCLMWPNYVVALGWMPWVVWWVERGWREGGRPLLLAVIIATLQMLSGVPEVILLTWGLLTAMLLGQLWLGGSAPGKLCARFAGMIALVAGLSAIQLLPFFDLLSHSQRGAGFATAKWAMPAWGWANLLVPMFHYCMTPQQTFFQAEQAFLTSYYLCVGVLALAVPAAWRVRTRRVWLLAALTLAALVMALGDNGPLYPLVKRAIPFLGLARYPVKFVLLAAFTVPLLAAFSLRACREFPADWRAPQWRPLWLAGLAMIGLMAVIVWVGFSHPLTYDQPRLTRTNALWRAAALGLTLAFCFGAFHAVTGRLALACRLGVLVLIAADAITHLPRQNPTLPKDALAPGIVRNALTFNPAVGPGVGRVMISPAAEEVLNFSGEPDMLMQFLGRRRALWSNLNLLDDIPKVNGSSTLQLREQMEVQSLLYGGKGTNFAGLMDFLNVAHLTSPGSAVEWQARASHLPLATVGARPVFADGPQTLRTLADPAFDGRQTVYLPPEARHAITATTVPDARAAIIRFSAQRVEVEVQTSQPAMLVVAQSYHAAWQAEVDGTPVPLWRANHAFQAVEVPAGRHEVVLAYRDRKFRGGAAVSAMTLLGCAAAWGRMKRRDLERVVA